MRIIQFRVQLDTPRTAAQRANVQNAIRALAPKRSLHGRVGVGIYWTATRWMPERRAWDVVVEALYDRDVIVQPLPFTVPYFLESQIVLDLPDKTNLLVTLRGES